MHHLKTAKTCRNIYGFVNIKISFPIRPRGLSILSAFRVVNGQNVLNTSHNNLMKFHTAPLAKHIHYYSYLLQSFTNAF
jgi:hypothetical protein